MCGRYTLFVKPEQLKNRFKAELPAEQPVKPRYNIAPTQPVPIITSEMPRRMEFARWGLIPSWAKDTSIGNKLINARAETLLEKPSFRSAFQKRRCLVIADGFYEWQQIGKTKQPMYVRLQSGEPFALAGLWEDWSMPAPPDGETQGTAQGVSQTIRSCTIITTEPNELLATMHHRMAVMLLPEDEDAWLDESLSTQELVRFLRPYPGDVMKAYPVSTLVNVPKRDDPSLIEPLDVGLFG